MADEEKGAKWWIRYVIVPLLAGGGILATFVIGKISKMDAGDSVKNWQVTPPPDSGSVQPSQPNQQKQISDASKIRHRTIAPNATRNPTTEGSSNGTSSARVPSDIPLTNPVTTSASAVDDSSVKLFTGHSVQDKLRLCEEADPNPFLVGDCAILTWDGTEYNAVWGGIKPLSERDLPPQPSDIRVLGTIRIERKGENNVVLQRHDLTGIACEYHGSISGPSVALGTHVCDLQGEQLGVGHWKLVPKP